MKVIFIIVLVFVISLPGFSQFTEQSIHSLYEMGVEKRDDSLFVKKEVIRLFTDSDYRKIVYPSTYNWAQAVELLKNMQLKIAFWHLINLYEQDTTNRSLVLGTFLAYDSVMRMDQVLVSTFYTYAFADPKVSHLVRNKPDIFRPDLLEKGLLNVKEIVDQIWYSRRQGNLTNRKE